jgi:hypothetical protein
MKIQLMQLFEIAIHSGANDNSFTTQLMKLI